MPVQLYFLVSSQTSLLNKCSGEFSCNLTRNFVSVPVSNLQKAEQKSVEPDRQATHKTSVAVSKQSSWNLNRKQRLGAAGKEKVVMHFHFKVWNTTGAICQAIQPVFQQICSENWLMKKRL